MRLWLVLLAAIATSPAWASDASRRDSDHAYSRRVAAKFAGCTIDIRRREAVNALDAPFGGADTPSNFARFLDPVCLQAARAARRAAPAPGVPQDEVLTLPHLVMRGLLYEALYRKDFVHAGAGATFAAAAPVEYRSDGDDKPGSLARNYRALMRIGDCAVRAAPALARDLVLSTVASADEDRAVAALSPAWQGCMPHGAQLSFSPEMMRGTIAEPLYRLTERDRHSSPAGGQ